MASNIRIINKNLLSGPDVVLAASSSAPALPVTAIPNTDRTAVWRSLSQTGDQYILVDLVAPQAVTCAALANPKVQGVGGTIALLQGGSGGAPGAWTTVAVFPAADPYTLLTYAFFNSVTARWWAIYYTNGVPGVADYAELGFAALGTYLEPTKGVIQPVQMTRTNPSIRRDSIDGQRRVAKRTRYFAGIWRFDNVNQTDANNLLALDNTFGIGTPFFAVLDSSIGWQAWLVYLTQGLDIPRMPATLYSISLPWEEAR